MLLKECTLTSEEKEILKKFIIKQIEKIAVEKSVPLAFLLPDNLSTNEETP
jgi:hypothetical protein